MRFSRFDDCRISTYHARTRDTPNYAITLLYFARAIRCAAVKRMPSTPTIAFKVQNVLHLIGTRI